MLRSVFGLFFLFCVGYSLTAILFPEGEIDSIERFALSIVLSASIVLLTAMILGLTPVGLSLSPAIVTLSFLTLCFTLIHVFQRGRKKKTSTNGSIRKMDYLIITLLLISSVLIPIRNVLAVEFFYAYDPFTTVAYANEIIVDQSISYTLPGEPLYYLYIPNFSGFFALTATVSILLGISPFTLVRWGGPLMLVVSVLCIFALARKIRRSQIFSVLAPFFFYITPLIIYRYILGIRENLILANYILIILLLGEAMENLHRKDFVLRRVFTSALLLGVAINSHQSWILIPFILLLQIFSGIFSRVPKDELKKLFYLSILFIMLSFLFGLLSLPAIIDALTVYTTYQGGIPYYEYAPESLPDFFYWLNVPVLLLSILGIIIFLCTKSKRTKSLIFLFILFLLALFLTQAPTFGIGMPGRRFVTYLSIPISIFSSLALCYIISKFRARIPSVRQLTTKKDLVHRMLMRIVLPLLLVSSIATQSFFVAFSVYGFLPWRSEDVDAAMRLKNLVQSSSGPVITHDFGLVQFSSVSNYEPDLFIVQKILGISSYTELIDFLTNQYGGRFSRVYFLISFQTYKYIKENAPDFDMHLASMELVYNNTRSSIYMVSLS